MLTDDERRRRLRTENPHLAEDGIVRDGQRVRVPAFLADHAVDAPALLGDAEGARAAMIANLAAVVAARPSPAFRIEIPADVVAGMTSADMSTVLPAIGDFNDARDATGRRLALDRLHGAVLRQFGGTAPAGLTADAARCRARDYLAGALAGAREGFR